METTYMDYNHFKEVLDTCVFKNTKKELLKRIVRNPNRFVGLFRPTKPKAKPVQNITQSNEIKFGGAFEIIISKYLALLGFRPLERRFRFENDILELDQLVIKNDMLVFVEQKLRDDHDSTKKRGQIENFKKKVEVLKENFSEYRLFAIMYFVDPSLTKNKNYYLNELKLISENFGIETHLFYGKELFQWLNYPDVWPEIISHLKRWKDELPEIPNVNFDENPMETFQEIKDISPPEILKLLSNNEVLNNIVMTLFPQKATLKLLLKHYKNEIKKTNYHKQVIEILNDIVENDEIDRY